MAAQEIRNLLATINKKDAPPYMYGKANIPFGQTRKCCHCQKELSWSFASSFPAILKEGKVRRIACCDDHLFQYLSDKFVRKNSMILEEISLEESDLFLDTLSQLCRDIRYSLQDLDCNPFLVSVYCAAPEFDNKHPDLGELKHANETPLAMIVMWIPKSQQDPSWKNARPIKGIHEDSEKRITTFLQERMLQVNLSSLICKSSRRVFTLGIRPK